MSGQCGPCGFTVPGHDIDYAGRKSAGLFVTLFVNWFVKPFSMALFGWFFVRVLFSGTFGWIDPEIAKNYTAGLIILAAAPCTAVVFVWSYLTDGDGPYMLAQVAINDLIMIFAFAPIVAILVGVSGFRFRFKSYLSPCLSLSLFLCSLAGSAGRY